MNWYVGIDPGLEGAIAWVNEDVSDCIPMPITGNRVDAVAVRGLLARLHPCRIALEKQQVMHKPGQKEGPTGAFTMGVNYGILLACCAPYPVFEVRPQSWKPILNGTKKDKAAAIAFAKLHYPDIILRRTERCTTDSHGMADALCIATFAQRAKAKRK